MSNTRSTHDSPFLPQTELQHSAMYTRAMEKLVGVVQALSEARDLNSVVRIARDAARNLTDADGASFILRDGDKCYYVDENAIAPLWKGMRFPLNICISGWAMLNKAAAVIEDIYADPRIPHEAYRPTFVKSLAMVPIREAEPIGAIGIYWAIHHRPSDEEVAILQALANTTSVAMENVLLYADLKNNLQTLKQQEARISEQTDALEALRGIAADIKALKHPERDYVSLMKADVSSNTLVPVTSPLATFLMFDGLAEEVMTAYVKLFSGSKILNIQRYGAGQAGREGSVMHATFTLKGLPFMCNDTVVRHDFGFTPAISLYMTCSSVAEIEQVYTELAQGGKALMSLANYGFSQKFGWVTDRFGVSWQLNLP